MRCYKIEVTMSGPAWDTLKNDRNLQEIFKEELKTATGLHTPGLSKDTYYWGYKYDDALTIDKSIEEIKQAILTTYTLQSVIGLQAEVVFDCDYGVLPRNNKWPWVKNWDTGFNGNIAPELSEGYFRSYVLSSGPYTAHSRVIFTPEYITVICSSIGSLSFAPSERPNEWIYYCHTNPSTEEILFNRIDKHKEATPDDVALAELFQSFCRKISKSKNNASDTLNEIAQWVNIGLKHRDLLLNHIEGTDQDFLKEFCKLQSELYAKYSGRITISVLIDPESGCQDLWFESSIRYSDLSDDEREKLETESDTIIQQLEERFKRSERFWIS